MLLFFSFPSQGHSWETERLFYCRWYVGMPLTYHTCQPWEGPFVITHNCQFTRWPSRERRNRLEQIEVLLQMLAVYPAHHKWWILTRKEEPKHFPFQLTDTMGLSDGHWPLGSVFMEYAGPAILVKGLDLTTVRLDYCSNWLRKHCKFWVQNYREGTTN